MPDKSASHIQTFDNVLSQQIEAGDSVSQTRNNSTGKAQMKTFSRMSSVSKPLTYSSLSANSKMPYTLWDALRLQDANKYKIE